MRAVVYAGTRNLYDAMVTAAKSLLSHTKVDRIYFLTEDDTFPEPLPEVIQTVNVSKQGYFPPNCANSRTQFTYMSLMRVCYSKLFPDLDRVLQLDVDTIVTDDISELWEIDMKGKYFAAVRERRSGYRPFGWTYYNIGVAMFNLDEIRKDHADDLAIWMLREKHMPYIDQDAWNCIGTRNGKDMGLSTEYNECCVTGWSYYPKIVHFAGVKDWQTNTEMFRYSYLEETRNKTWEEALHG